MHKISRTSSSACLSRCRETGFSGSCGSQDSHKCGVSFSSSRFGQYMKGLRTGRYPRKLTSERPSRHVLQFFMFRFLPFFRLQYIPYQRNLRQKLIQAVLQKPRAHSPVRARRKLSATFMLFYDPAALRTPPEVRLPKPLFFPRIISVHFPAPGTDLIFFFHLVLLRNQTESI